MIATDSIDPSSCLTAQEAAGRLRLAASTLAKLRLSGAGPKYLKLGRAVRYRICDLTEWQNGRLRVSTSGAVQESVRHELTGRDQVPAPSSWKATRSI